MTKDEDWFVELRKRIGSQIKEMVRVDDENLPSSLAERLRWLEAEDRKKQMSGKARHAGH